MNARPPSATAHAEAWSGVRRQLALHRRKVSTALMFVAVLLGLAALGQTSEPPPLSVGPDATPSSAVLVDAHLAVPVRLADSAVVTLLDPGDVVDVLVADRRGRARLVAADLTVTAVPAADSGGPWADSDGLLMVAATEAQALSLAGAAARGPVTVAVHP